MSTKNVKINLAIINAGVSALAGQLGRRRALAAMVCAVGALAGPALAQTEAYPARPVRILVPYPPGGPIDVLARTIAERLAVQLGQAVYVESKPGANTIIGADHVAKSAPDGYTILLTTSGTLISNVVFYPKLPYAPKDFVGLTQISRGTVILVGAGNAPYSNLKQFAQWARTQGRPISFASWGAGSVGHMFGELLKKNYGIALNHVPYRGDQAAYNDIRGGVLDVAFGSTVSAKPMIAAGYLKAIGMTGPRRAKTMPDLPTFAEQGFTEFDLAGYTAAYVPSATPRRIVEQLSREMIKVLNIPEVVARLLEQGQDPIANSTEEAEHAYRREFPLWEAMIKSTGVTPPQ